MRRDGVHIGGANTWRGNSKVSRSVEQLFEQIVGPVRAELVNNLIQSFQPFRGLLRIQVILPFFFCFQHFVRVNLTIRISTPWCKRRLKTGSAEGKIRGRAEIS
jgi:hypothetical protein